MALMIDFVICIDGSGSIGDCIDALRDNLSLFINELSSESSVHDWRGKIVVYRDQVVDGERWLEDNPFVQNDAAALHAQLSRVEAQDSSGGPPSTLDVLHLLSTMDQTDRSAQEVDPNKWRYRSDAARVVILFTDASFKTPMTYPGGAGGTLVDAQTAIMNNKIQLIMHAPDTEDWEELSCIDKCEWQPIPGPDFGQGLRDMVLDPNFRRSLSTAFRATRRANPMFPIMEL